MQGRLQKKGFLPQIIRKTIEYLSELHYLDDENFAKAWAQTKTQSNPIGRHLLRYQLRQKGVAAHIVEKVFAECIDQYDEHKAAKELVSLRLARYKGIAPQKLKRRLYDYLRRRGFSQEAILQALKQNNL